VPMTLQTWRMMSLEVTPGGRELSMRMSMFLALVWGSVCRCGNVSCIR
jgi:hypothetical protein